MIAEDDRLDQVAEETHRDYLAELEAEAAELYPAETWNSRAERATVYGQRAARVRAKTITAEQVEQAARAEYEHAQQDRSMSFGPPWPQLPPEAQRKYLNRVRRTFSAAGFYVQEGD